MRFVGILLGSELGHRLTMFDDWSDGIAEGDQLGLFVGISDGWLDSSTLGVPEGLVEGLVLDVFEGTLLVDGVAVAMKQKKTRHI